MKRQFALLLITPEAPKAGIDYPTCSPPPAAKPTPATDRLRKVGTNFNLTTYSPADLVGPPPDFMGDAEFPLYRIPRDVVMLIGGEPTAEQLKEVCTNLANLNFDFIVVVDGLENRAALRDVLSELNEGVEVDLGDKKVREPVQLGVVGELGMLLKSRRPMLYAYPRADATTTTVVIMDAGTPEATVLTIVRDRNPFKDMESLPGGFLNIYVEDLPTCAAREVSEECNVTVNASDLLLVDVRSSTTRDERGHVVDHGYVWFVPADKKAAVLATVKAGDDAKPGTARFALVSDVLTRSIAFDHRDLLVEALKLAPQAVSAK